MHMAMLSFLAPLTTTPSDDNVEFEVLDMLEFDSERRCMSIVTKQNGGTKITLYTKGADSVIYSNLLATEQTECTAAVRNNDIWTATDIVELRHTMPPCSPTYIDGREQGNGINGLNHGERSRCDVEISDMTRSRLNATREHLDMYARIGLRTLCLAKRVRLHVEHFKLEFVYVIVAPIHVLVCYLH